MAFEWVYLANLRGPVGPVGPPGDGGFKGNLASGADLDTYYGLTYDGYWAVTTDTIAASLLNAPPDAKAGTFHVFKVGSTAANQAYIEYGAAGRIFYSAATSTGRSRPWENITPGVDPAFASTPDGNRTAPLSVTRGWSGGTTTGSGFVKSLVTLPPRTKRARIVVRNVNPRFTTADSAAATLSTVSIGLSSGTADSSQTGPVTVATGASTGSSGYYSPWFNAAAFAGKDAIIGLDWSSAGTVQTNIGFGWTGAGTGATSTGATGASTGTLPFHIYVEVEIPANVPVIAAWGDSISSAVGATRPVYDSWLNQFCRTIGAAPVHFTHSGDAMDGSWEVKSAKWKEFGAQYQAADVVICAMGSNDVFGGADLPAMQSRFLAALPLLRRFVSPNVIAATVLPRDAVTGAVEDVRRSYNTWLATQDVRRVLRFAATASADDETIIAGYNADGIHLNTAGYGALAGVIPANVIAIEGMAVFDSKRSNNPAYAHAWTDNVGKTPLGIRLDGTVEAAGGLDTPRAGKTIGDSNGLSFAVTSPAGLVGELALGMDGSVPAWVLSRWASRMGVSVSPVRTTALALTHASGTAQIDTRTAVQVRVPLRLGTKATIKAIHFRNYEDRSGLAYTGALTFNGVAFGESAHTASGQLNGNFASAPTALSGTFATPADGSEYQVTGLNVTIEAGKDYLLSYGYTCAAQNNQSGVGGSWTNTTPGNYTATTDTLTLGKFSPLDVWLEIETTAPIVAWCGDSLSCGVASEIPGYQSVPMVHARANGYIPLMYTHSGSAMTSWTNAGAVKYTKWASLAKPDALVFSLSKNDFLTTTDIPTLRTRFDTVYPVLTGATTKNMFLTTCLPSADETDAVGTAERAWNDVLLNEQLGNAVNVFDLRKGITAASGSGLDPVYDSGDGVHLNKRGYAKLATIIPHNLYTRG